MCWSLLKRWFIVFVSVVAVAILSRHIESTEQFFCSWHLFLLHFYYYLNTLLICIFNCCN
jgi:hypothetical protein